MQLVNTTNVRVQQSMDMRKLSQATAFESLYSASLDNAAIGN